MIKLKGGAGFAVGLSIRDVVHAVALDQKRILPVSSLVNGPYGIRDVCISVPTVVGRKASRPARDRALAQGNLGPAASAQVLRETIDAVFKSNPKAAGKSAADQGADSPASRAAASSNGSRPVRVTMGSGGGNGATGNSRVTISGQGKGSGDVMEKSLDRKLAAIHADPGCREFILADAKDADMALRHRRAGPVARDARRRGPLQDARGVPRADAADHAAGPGRHHAHVGQLQPCADDPRAALRRLARHAGRPGQRHDRHPPRPRRELSQQPSRPFRTASSTTSSAATSTARRRSARSGANLGLYSVTFNNDLERDLATLERFHEFREEAERKGFRYFLEVFDPNVPDAVDAGKSCRGYINDMIARMLGGVAPAGRPLFLKMVYHGPKAMEELVRYDPHLVVGILGGSAGTTCDAFQLLHDAQKYGARVALFGRKINNAENQLAFVQFLR